MAQQEPNESSAFLADHIEFLSDCYRRLTGSSLLPQQLSGVGMAKAAFHAPFVLVSHDASDDPIFTYANKTALQLFEMNWDEFTQLRSRESAEPAKQQERARLLSEVANKGVCEGYSGIRISKNGRRFEIKDVTVWNLVDAAGCYRGQAALYAAWEYL